MSSSMLMSIGTRAMFAAYAQLTTVSNNIANANTPGYSRQQTLLTTTEGQYSGSGFFGRGVTVQSVTRAANLFLTQQAASARAEAAGATARSTLLQQLEQVFGAGDTGLGNAATQVFNAFSDLAAAPADLSARQAVLARGEDLASMARSYADQVAMLQANVRSDVQNSVREVNTLAEQVATLNNRIVDALGSGHTPNDLFDARDLLVNQISDKIGVHTLTAADGSMSLFIAGGQNLVLSNRANQLVARPDDFEPSRIALGINVAGQVTPLGSSSLGSGALAGLLAFQDGDLVEARNRLGVLSAGLATTMNTQQSFGIDLSGASGVAMFEMGAPRVRPASSNVALASVSLAITDPMALKASEYLMVNDPVTAGTYQLTRVADGQVFSAVASGDVVDGFRLTIGVPAPAANDRFLLQPSSEAAAGMALAIRNPRAVAAGSPITAVASLANSGTGAVGSLAVMAAPTVAYAPLTVRFTNAVGGYDIVNAGNVVQASGTWTAGNPIAFNGFELSLLAQPALGDEFAVAPTLYPSASNGNALAFDALAERILIDGQTFADAYAQTLSEMGVRTQGAISFEATSQTVAVRSAEALTSEIGVNVDEEAAKLMQFQQAYQAAAKMLQTAQTVMDTLLELGR